jgi:hypothetical protein
MSVEESDKIMKNPQFLDGIAFLSFRNTDDFKKISFPPLNALKQY